MSTRERWIVYPLLFLALGIAMRDHFLPREHAFTANDIRAERIRCEGGEYGKFSAKEIRAGRILCDELVVVGPNGVPVVVANSDRNSTAGGVVITLDRFGRPTGLLGRARVSVHRQEKPDKSPKQQPTETEPDQSTEDASE